MTRRHVEAVCQQSRGPMWATRLLSQAKFRSGSSHREWMTDTQRMGPCALQGPTFLSPIVNEVFLKKLTLKFLNCLNFPGGLALAPPPCCNGWCRPPQATTAGPPCAQFTSRPLPKFCFCLGRQVVITSRQRQHACLKQSLCLLLIISVFSREESQRSK